ncbi:MAG TPA: Rrf2 family transcriptional regulator [Candidatus Mediterraneibacter intestinavium]|nr:Rrf2 family transcriptional regulator [Candidatus Mediterraneibacter intestinavium]
MKLSTKGRYGLRALIDLAVHSSGGTPVSITSISARQDLSERYLEQLMAKLKKAGLIQSVRGAGGGYVLARDPGKISVGDVLRALEGNLDPVDCAGLDPDGVCRAADSCVTKYVWKRINESINRTVDEIRLDQLVEESREKNKEVGRDGQDDLS